MKTEFTRLMRWLHIYLSMFSFAALLFFAITGITLNHTSWIEGQQRAEQAGGNMKMSWVYADSVQVDQLNMVEHLRNQHNIKAKLTDFVTDETECSISFKGPGYAADALVDRTTGNYEIIITKSGLIAIMNDLHKGRDSGTTWAWLIDVSAVLMILVSLTGFVMIFFLRKKRLNGLLITLFGAVIIVVIYYLFV